MTRIIPVFITINYSEYTIIYVIESEDVGTTISHKHTHKYIQYKKPTSFIIFIQYSVINDDPKLIIPYNCINYSDKYSPNI